MSAEMSRSERDTRASTLGAQHSRPSWTPHLPRWKVEEIKRLYHEERLNKAQISRRLDVSLTSVRRYTPAEPTPVKKERK